MLKVYRHNDEWKVNAIGEVMNGRVAGDLANEAKTFSLTISKTKKAIK